ncbi:TRAP transporter substrate-binding protein [Paenirhodobacter populi]|uniref:TRAP transporter substrate-binding protein n=1 Tax=Paenirhodobacter populi TaxID=2306993 RepID=A0A443JAN6_9RHOB|nr:TRAP transporter substrate-binding protein [Sinirhodobacter populi]RWR05224.1 TRAP transporter substrate-binding protein [Sinirhodobacter populi]RWR17459.1 TRAP transporter substrate-binding protein [Sinirhodobacter populi]
MSILKWGAVAAALSVAVPAAAETLKFAHFVAPTHTLTEAIVTPLTEAVAPLGLAIETYPAGKLGAGPAEQYVRVVQGVADIVWGLPGYTSSQFRLTMLTELPGALPAGMTGADFLWNGWDAGLLTKEFPATVPLALWTAEPAVLILRDKVVREPADMKGLKIRVSSSITAKVVEMLDAIPVQMPAGDVYNALQTGLVDGVITGSSAISDFKFDEVLKHVTLGIPLGNQSFFVVANAKRVAKLPEGPREALLKAGGRVLSRHAEAAWHAKSDTAIAGLHARGPDVVTDLTPEEIAAFDAILLPFTQKTVAAMKAEAAFKTMRGE